MDWDDPAEATLAAFCEMVPETFRSLAEASARDEAEGLASERNATSVGVDDVVRAWIRTTPPEQRNGLVAIIESFGLEPESYAEELESAEGWDDSEEPSDPSR
jgi:hypothetical protein